MPDFLSPAELGLAPGEIAFCLAVVLAAGFMRGFTGFGFAMAAVPLLALVIAPVRAVPFVILLQLLAGLWDWREARRHAHWRSLPWLMAGALVGTPLGTLGLALLNAEWRFPIAGAFGGSVFVDGGNVWREIGDFESDQVRWGAGAGLRWLSPVGPLRVEIGWKLDPEPFEDPYVWFISLGNPF